MSRHSAIDSLLLVPQPPDDSINPETSRGGKAKKLHYRNPVSNSLVRMQEKAADSRISTMLDGKILQAP
jgi:hypothetical protein